MSLFIKQWNICYLIDLIITEAETDSSRGMVKTPRNKGQEPPRDVDAFKIWHKPYKSPARSSKGNDIIFISMPSRQERWRLRSLEVVTLNLSLLLSLIRSQDNGQATKFCLASIFFCSSAKWQ